MKNVAHCDIYQTKGPKIAHIRWREAAEAGPSFRPLRRRGDPHFLGKVGEVGTSPPISSHTYERFMEGPELGLGLLF